jgi:arylsulfatase A-like enzyme
MKPNIIFILIDDMGWRDLVCTGSDFYETPNIDRLAREGMQFTNAYAACPVCSPTRASIMSGKYPARVGVTDWIHQTWPADADTGHARGKLLDAPYIDHLPETEYSLARSLHDGGYQTWHIGKWHLGKAPWYPETHGFDVNIGGCERGGPHKNGYFAPWPDHPKLHSADCPDGTYLTDYLTDKTLELLQTRDADKPFFLNLWYYQVHTPLQAKKEKIQKYEEKAKRLGLTEKPVHEEGDYYPCEHKKDKRIQRRLFQSHPIYAAMIESLDENIGRVLDWLDSTDDPAQPGKKMSETTLVIFTSDNGGLATAEGSPTCNLPLAEGKGWRYEGGVRVPLLARWAGHIQSASMCEEIVTSTDFYPTFLEAAGLPLKPEQHCDGVSALPLLQGEGGIDREAVYWHYPHYGNQGGVPGAAVRKGKWKLIYNFEPVKDASILPGSIINNCHVELYNLETDEEEHNEISAEHPEVSKELLMLIQKWQEDVEAKIPAPNTDFVPWSAMHGSKGYMPLD